MFKSRRSELLLTLAAMMFASNGVSSKLLLDGHISSWRLAQIRSISAFLIIAIVVALRNPQALRITKAEAKKFALLGPFGVAAVNGLYFLSIHRMPVSIALLIEFTSPLWIVLYLRFVRKKVVPNEMWIALILAVTGLAVVAQVWDGFTLDLIGAIAALGSAFAVSFWFVVGESLTEKRDGTSIVMFGFGFAAIAWSLVLPIWNFPREIFTETIQLGGLLDGHSAPGWVLLTYVVLIGTVGPYLCVMAGLKNLKASTTSAFGMLEPVFAGVIAWFWFNESFTIIQLCGAAIVVAGIYMADRAREAAH